MPDQKTKPRARRSTGGILEPSGKRRSFAYRVRVDGKRYTISVGRPEDGKTREDAEADLRYTLEQIDRGEWTPPEPRSEPKAESSDPSFHEFASAWFEGIEPTLRERTCVDYRWRLSAHLLPYFAKLRLSEITVAKVKSYRAAKLRERKALEAKREAMASKPEAERERLPRPLSNGSINKTIRLLATILDEAVEDGEIDFNPAKNRKRLLRESKPSRTYLQPEQVKALLDAAGELDAGARDGDSGRRKPLLATLTLAGLRIGEALALRWRDVNLADRKLRVAASKTDTGVREVELTPTLQETLSEYRTRSAYVEPDDLVFATAQGRRDGPSNVRRRFLAPAVERANEALSEAGSEPIGNVTPHSLRRTFVSLLLAAGADVPKVMAQTGHADPKMTLGVYAKVIASKTDHGAALDGLVGQTGTGSAPSEAMETVRVG
jgi:integrase